MFSALAWLIQIFFLLFGVSGSCLVNTDFFYVYVVVVVVDVAVCLFNEIMLLSYLAFFEYYHNLLTFL